MVGLEESSPAPGVIDAITDADLVLVPPSNPVVVVGTILGVPGVREALVGDRGAGGRPLPDHRRHPRARAWPTRLLTAIGVEVGAPASALHYGARSAGGVLDGWLVDTVDAGEVAPGPRGAGSPVPLPLC